MSGVLRLIHRRLLFLGACYHRGISESMPLPCICSDLDCPGCDLRYRLTPNACPVGSRGRPTPTLRTAGDARSVAGGPHAPQLPKGRLRGVGRPPRAGLCGSVLYHQGLRPLDGCRRRAGQLFHRQCRARRHDGQPAAIHSLIATRGHRTKAPNFTGRGILPASASR